MAEMHHELLWDMKVVTANDDSSLVAQPGFPGKSYILNPGNDVLFQFQRTLQLLKPYAGYLLLIKPCR